MTIEALHVAAACFTTSTLAVTLAMWLTSEGRRSSAEARALAAEQRADASRAQTIALLVESVRLIGMTDGHLSAWADETPQAWTLDPAQERIRLAHSAAFSALRITSGALAAFQEGIPNGRQT